MERGRVWERQESVRIIPRHQNPWDCVYKARLGLYNSTLYNRNKHVYHACTFLSVCFLLHFLALLLLKTSSIYAIAALLNKRMHANPPNNNTKKKKRRQGKNNDNCNPLCMCGERCTVAQQLAHNNTHQQHINHRCRELPGFEPDLTPSCHHHTLTCSWRSRRGRRSISSADIAHDLLILLWGHGVRPVEDLSSELSPRGEAAVIDAELKPLPPNTGAWFSTILSLRQLGYCL